MTHFIPLSLVTVSVARDHG